MKCRVAYFIGFLIVVFTTTAQSIFACSCLYTPKPPCFAFGSAGSIFEGVVLDIKRVERNEENGYEARRVKFRVLNTHKGEKRSTRDVYTGDGAADYGYKFKVGKRYLVYAYGDGSAQSTGKCTRTRQMKDAVEDQEYFANLSSRSDGVRIYGTVERYNLRGQNSPLENIQIQIKGEQNIDIRTDGFGKYEIERSPPGKYEIKVLIPEIFRLSWSYPLDASPLPVYFEEGFDKGCIEANFVLEPK